MKSGEQLVLSLYIDSPCLHDYPEGYLPVCPKNHRDSIVPILYGLIARIGKDYVKEKQDLKVKYGGCVITGCDPQYYCKLHDITFLNPASR